MWPMIIVFSGEIQLKNKICWPFYIFPQNIYMSFSLLMLASNIELGMKRRPATYVAQG